MIHVDSANIRYEKNQASQGILLTYLNRVANEFIPNLHEQVSDFEAYTKKIFDKADVFEAWYGNDLIGMVAAYLNDDEKGRGFITSVSVDPDFQGMGLAKELLLKVILYATKKRYKKICLETENDKAIGLYKTMGFNVIVASKKSSLSVLELYIG